MNSLQILYFFKKMLKKFSCGLPEQLLRFSFMYWVQSEKASCWDIETELLCDSMSNAHMYTVQ